MAHSFAYKILPGVNYIDGDLKNGVSYIIVRYKHDIEYPSAEYHEIHEQMVRYLTTKLQIPKDFIEPVSLEEYQGYNKSDLN